MSALVMGAARALSSNLSALEATLKQTVLEVRTRGSASGAGIIWGGAGLIITNAHCAPRGVELQVETQGRWRSAELLAYHPHHDLALLAAPGVSGPLLAFRDAESLRVGELVFAYGHPLGVRDAVAMGVINTIARDSHNAPRWIVADVRLAPGNSGGPLVDAEGSLVGVNSMVVNGLGLAIPASLVERFVERALSKRAA
jgi:serine protease Do